jgi:adenine C2-methylase RlmN of 23S rRNA A2503 and tRNA A37
MNEQIAKQLEDAGFDYAVAVATQAEIAAGAACGQLAIIHESE